MSLHDITFIVAEDDEGHYKLTERSLRRAGFNNKIIHFSNGDDLARFFESCIFKSSVYRDLSNYFLLLDINMPKKNGIEVLSLMKDKGLLERIPTIVLSSCCDSSTIAECLGFGCNSYIEKPPGNDLVGKIKDITESMLQVV